MCSVCMYVGKLVEVRGQLAGLIIFLYHVGLKSRIRAIGLGSKCPSLPNEAPHRPSKLILPRIT